MPLSKYHLGDISVQQKEYVVYRGEKKEDGRPVFIKVPIEQDPSQSLADHYSTLRDALDGIGPEAQLVEFHDSHALVWDSPDDEPLEAPAEIRLFLEAAIGMTEVISTLHSRGFVYGAIRPSSFSYLSRPAEQKVRLSSPFCGLHESDVGDPDQIEPEDFAYIAPEWTGRTNDPVDFRSDLYSLGVTFFELLTGRLPFESTDSLELIHCHLAKEPETVKSLRSEVPEILSRMVSTLLSKNPKSRYQSAQGLRHDLIECLSQLDEMGMIEEFTLGLLDNTSVFRLPDGLFGRKSEIKELFDAFGRACSGEREFFVIAGPSGIGKSALIKETRLPVLAEGGIFLSGTFEHLRLGEPYVAIAQAFKEFADHVLSLDEDQVEVWKKSLEKALGRFGSLITDIVPELELLIGEQPPVIELPPDESQARFNLVLRRFVRAIATEDHPLVLFLDDLQWADSASLVFLSQILTDTRSGHMLILGAYRNDEKGTEILLSRLFEELARNRVPLNTLVLEPLEIDTVIRVLVEMLKCDSENARPLAEVCLRKTLGNPLFLQTFLTSAYDKGHIWFSNEEGGWLWDLEEIRQRPSTENVVDLLIEKILTLPETTQELLKLASCMGGSFDAHSLAAILDREEQEVSEDLNIATESGLFVESVEFVESAESVEQRRSDRLGSTKAVFQFTHNRISQAAGTMLDEVKRSEYHFSIARNLEEQLGDEARERYLYEIADHYNMCQELLVGREARERIAELNFAAGKQASHATAHESALAYFGAAMDLLGPEAWTGHYELVFELHILAARSAYLQTEYEKAEQYIEEGVAKAKTLLERVPLHIIFVRLLATTDRRAESIHVALGILREFGIDLPENPNNYHALRGLLRTKAALFGKKIETLKDLPEASDPKAMACHLLISSIGASAYIMSPQLLPLLIFENLLLCLKYGTSHVTPYVYVSYGLILAGVLGDIEGSRRFSDLAKYVAEKHGQKEFVAKYQLTDIACNVHWTQPLRDTIVPLADIPRRGLEVGDAEYSMYGVYFSNLYGLLSGQPLDILSARAKGALEEIRRQKNLPMLSLMSFLSFLIESFHTPDEKMREIPADEYWEKSYQDLSIRITENQTGVCFLGLFRLMSSYMFGDYDEAERASEVASQYLDSITASAGIPLYAFFDSLQLFARIPKMDTSQKNRALRRVRKHLRSYKKWARYCPENILQRQKLLEAELARFTGEFKETLRLYQQAAELAQQGEYLLEEALSYECASRFCKEQKFEDFADYYAHRALDCYKRWGAWGKADHLERQNPRWERTIRTTSSTSSIKPSSLPDRAKAMDLATVFKASQAISGEIVLDRLIRRIMDIVLESAGASRGCLLLHRKDKLAVVAERSVKDEAPKKRITIPPEEANLPLSVINYVYRTKKHVVLVGTNRDEGFWADPYFEREKTKSLLCTAIVTRSEILGVLYVENDQTEVGFGDDRVDLLKILSGQVAISLQNAMLYDQMQSLNEQLEQKVIERTAQLKSAQDALVEKAHKAGMADVASQVLHDVGNLLNSVSTSAHMINKTVKESNVHRLDKIHDIIKDIDSVEDFVQSDERAPTLFNFFIKMNRVFQGEIERLDNESQRMLRGVQSIEEVLAIQQQYIQAPSIVEKLFLEEIVEHSLTLSTVAYNSSGIEISKQFETASPVLAQRVKLVQVLLALFENAEEALETSDSVQKKITISIVENEKFGEIHIHDNGTGIPEDDLAKIFSHGFTTKGKGRGFALHTSANSIKEMGGKIWAEPVDPGALIKIRLPLAIKDSQMP